MQGATTVGCGFYMPTTYLAKLTRISTQHNAIFPNAKDTLLGRSKMQFVKSADKLLITRDVSLSKNGSSSCGPK
jgi:hypothetical protein